MRWIKFDASANGIFSREVCPEDSDYLHNHIDTFKCMWHEQTRNYWVRMVASLREYVKKHIFTEECLERLGAPVEIFELVIDCAYVNICSSFTQESFGKAKEFLLATISVTASREVIANIGARPLSNDPFYNKFTRDFFRTVFGPPSSTIKSQLQVNLTAPLYGRFAAGVVAVLKQWVQTPDCSLKRYVVDFHQKPYWSYPSDFCPQKTLFKYLDDNCGGWETPDWDEVQQVMLKAPDRETEFIDTVDYLTKALAEHEGDLFHLGDYRDNYDSEEGVSRHGIKNWTDIMFGVCEQLELTAPYHFEELCLDCLAASDYEWSDTSDDLYSLSGLSGDDSDPDEAHCDDAFWREPWVVAQLHEAEKKYKETNGSKGLGIHININIGGGLTGVGANTPRKARRKPQKMPPHAAAAATNASVVTNGTTANASKQKATNGTTANAGKQKATNGTTTSATKPKAMNKTGAAGKPNTAKQQPSSKKPGARPTINLEDSAEKSAEVAAALERLKLNIGTPPAPQQLSAKAVKVENKPSTNGSAAAAPKVPGRKCAKCGKSEGCKLKKCSLCVQNKMEPAYYCSRECQMDDWEDHQALHTDDLD